MRERKPSNPNFSLKRRKSWNFFKEKTFILVVINIYGIKQKQASFSFSSCHLRVLLHFNYIILYIFFYSELRRFNQKHSSVSRPFDCALIQNQNGSNMASQLLFVLKIPKSNTSWNWKLKLLAKNVKAYLCYSQSNW